MNQTSDKLECTFGIALTLGKLNILEGFVRCNTVVGGTPLGDLYCTLYDYWVNILRQHNHNHRGQFGKYSDAKE